ncbi:MAG: helix-turn-helix domain-containing protein [Blastocatellia bacterium]|nr:helix-turn-helix domain-containing protein [Blastocatellia bacterium]
MGKTKVIELSTEKRLELENGYKNGKSHSFRQRCQIILLKSEKRTAVEIKSILGCCEMVVNNWVKRYESEGIKGLQTRAGRGRKTILQTVDLEQVKKAVKENRQRLSVARGELEESLGKEFSMNSLKRFLKKTVETSNELESD